MRSARGHFPKPRENIRVAPSGMCESSHAALRLLEERVLVRVRRRAHAEDGQLARAVVLERVPGTRRDQDRVAGPHPAGLAVDLELARPFRDEVDLLGSLVVVPFRGLRRLERGLGEALRRRPVELADRRAVLRRERLGSVEALELQSAAARTSATRSWADASIPVKNGSARERELTSSDTGHSPSPKP